jgi:crossover junction endodeoxyribonuclease RuvC
MAVVLGVDPSTHTGIVALDGLQIIEATEITCKKKFDQTVDRALALSDQLVRIVERTQPSLIVFEGYGYSNQHTLALLVEIGTVFRVITRLLDIPHIEIAPTSLKKVVTGSGTAKKDLMLLEVFKRWGFEAKTDNIADAFGLAVCGQELLGFDTGIPKTHKDGLKKVKMPN